MDLEEMKRQWSTLDGRNDNVESSVNNKKLDGMKTAQQQLISQYRVFGSIGATFAIISYFIFLRLDINAWFTACFPIFFAACALMDFFLQRKAGEISLTSMSVIEVAEKAAACRRLHHIFQLILIPSGVVLLAFLAYAMTDNKAFIYGMCIGAVFGVVFGLRAYFKLMDNYKSLIKE